MSSSSHRDAHPYGRSHDDVRRRDRRRRRQRRVRITQLIVFSIAMIGIIVALVYAWKQLTAEDPQASGPSDAGAAANVAVGEDGTQCPEPGAKPAAPKSVEVTVLNGTSRGGLAGSVTDSLDERGFSTGKAGNTKSAKGAITVVHGPSGYLEASAVAAEFDDATLRLDDREDATVDVLIGDGFKDLVDEDEADSRLEKAVEIPQGCEGAEDASQDDEDE
jgi:hypothetical protein